ncbi:amino acid ABC transporter permease [Aquamicrobium terrae]|uniref:Polar amino acid transport system permease protein n=1 Tax=Aquamicrobium terrae TaxID=1324945 RepID=A0ABV2N127_9HYPH
MTPENAISVSGQSSIRGRMESEAASGEAIIIAPRRHPWRWIGGAVAVFLMWRIVNSMIYNENFGWDIVAEYLFSPVVLSGLGLTIWLTVVAMTLGIILGLVLAVMALSSNPMLRYPADVYLWLFRGTPVLVQLIFWYNLAALYPVIQFGLPFGDVLAEYSTNALITPYTAALLGLSLNEAAYMAEITRAGIASIDYGQEEAAKSLGMSRVKTLRRIILPQALRVIIPPTGNQVIGMLKMTSLVSVISLYDLLYSVQGVSARTFQVIPMLIVACAWYLLMTSILSIGQKYIEKLCARDAL